MTKINVSEICRKNILSFYDMITSMGLEIDIAIPEIFAYAHGNEEALDRVLNNLLSNAVAYGAAGNIIGLTVRNDDTNILLISGIVGRGSKNIILIMFLKECIHLRIPEINPSKGVALA